MNGTTAELHERYWVSLEDLIYGTMLPSGNDAAYSLAEYVGYLIMNRSKKYFLNDLTEIDLSQVNTSGLVKEFIKKMNEKS